MILSLGDVEGIIRRIVDGTTFTLRPLPAQAHRPFDPQNDEHGERQKADHEAGGERAPAALLAQRQQQRCDGGAKGGGIEGTG